MTIEELKQALEAAAPLPWKAMNGDKRNKNMHQKFGPVICKAPLSQADFDLLRAVNNLPKLVKVAEAAQKFQRLHEEGAFIHEIDDAHLEIIMALEELNND